MKYLIFILSLIVFGIAGCKQNTTGTYGTNLSGNMDIGKNNIEPISTGGKLSGFLSITGTIKTIFISGHNITYKDLFSINIPKDLNTWSYNNLGSKSPNNENLAFSEKAYPKYFYITVGDTNLLNRSLIDKDICLLETNYNGSPTSSKKTIAKIMNNKNIFITQLTFFTKGNIGPYIYITHFCFVTNSIMYDFVLDNYNFSQANKIIDSFTFL